MAVQQEYRRTIQENGCQPQPQARGRLHVRSEGAIHNVTMQCEQRQDHSYRTHSGVVPAKLGTSPHHSCGNEDAQRHCHQKEFAHEERNRRIGKRVQDVVQ